jgi:hypothetical protein
MAVSSISAQQYQCDGCGAYRYGLPGEPVSGYDGIVNKVTPDGEIVRSLWWAHTRKCIGNAVRNALDRRVAAIENEKAIEYEKAHNPPRFITAELPPLPEPKHRDLPMSG